MTWMEEEWFNLTALVWSVMSGALDPSAAKQPLRRQRSSESWRESMRLSGLMTHASSLEIRTCDRKSLLHPPLLGKFLTWRVGFCLWKRADPWVYNNGREDIWRFGFLLFLFRASWGYWASRAFYNCLWNWWFLCFPVSFRQVMWIALHNKKRKWTQLNRNLEISMDWESLCKNVIGFTFTHWVRSVSCQILYFHSKL